MATMSLFPRTAPSLTVTDATDTPVTLGMLWKSAINGAVNSLLVYIANTNIGGQAGSALVYAGDGWGAPPGAQLARKDFTYQNTTGWQEIVLDTPVTITAGTLYIAAMFVGGSGSHYCATGNYFTTEITAGPLTALRGDAATYDLGNGRLVNGSTPAYPQNRSSTLSNYWIDITFDDLINGGSGITATVASSAAVIPVGSPVTLTATPSGGGPYTYAWSVARGSGSFGAPSSATTSFTPSALGEHTARCLIRSGGANVSGYVTIDTSAATVDTPGTFNTTVTDSLGAAATGGATRTVHRGGTRARQRRSLYGSRLSFGDAVTNPTPIYELLASDPATYVIKTLIQRDCVLKAIRFLKAPLAAGDHFVVAWRLGTTTPLVLQRVPLIADNGRWVDVPLDVPVDLTASGTVPYLIGYYAASGHAVRAQWVYGSQDTLEYPFLINTNGGGFGDTDGSGYSIAPTVVYPGTTGVPSGWQGHAYMIDPVVEWDADDAVYTGGPEYFQRFASFSSLTHFPLGAWASSPASIPDFKAIGINTVVGTADFGDPVGARAAIVTNDIDVVPFIGINDLATLAVAEADTAYQAHVRGYLTRDEPDLVGPWTPPADLQAWHIELRKRAPGKLLFFNFGYPVVVNKGFQAIPAGTSPKDLNAYWRQFARITDIVSCDFYMEDPANHQNGAYDLWCNPRMIRRLGDLADHSRPVWHFIATTAPPGTEPSPATVYSSVWASLIGGARGIIFFDYQFTAGGAYITDHAMATNSAMKTMVTSLCALIQSLAAPLLAPEAPLAVTVASSNTGIGDPAAITGGEFGVPIHYTIRQAAGTTYLFTQSIRPGTTTGTFTVPAAANKTITVISESRTITANGSGVFTDNYTADYQVHLYQWA